MTRVVYRHDPVIRIVAGTVGEPGLRKFFLQVHSAHFLNCVAIEKTQLLALVQRMQQITRELRRNQLISLDELNMSGVQDDQPLEYPISEDFTAGVIAISWDQEEQRLNIEIQALQEREEDLSELLSDDEALQIEDAPELLQMVIRIHQSRSFCERALLVIAAGRPACPFCGIPVDPSGHLCPRANGYRR